MIDFVQLILGVPWWFRLLRRSPARALVVLMVELIAAVALVVGTWKITDPRLEILLFAVVVLGLAGTCLWASLTAPEPPEEQPTRTDDWTPPSAEEVDRVIGGRISV